MFSLFRIAWGDAKFGKEVPLGMMLLLFRKEAKEGVDDQGLPLWFLSLLNEGELESIERGLMFIPPFFFL